LALACAAACCLCALLLDDVEVCAKAVGAQDSEEIRTMMLSDFMVIL
jgi:hypothetical protein